MAVLICASPPLSASNPAQDFFSNRLFGGIQRAVIAPLRDSSQTVAERVLVSGWAGSAAYACHALDHSG